MFPPADLIGGRSSRSSRRAAFFVFHKGSSTMKLRDLVNTAGRADIDDAVAAERAMHERAIAISTPNTGHATSPVITQDADMVDALYNPFLDGSLPLDTDDGDVWDEPFAEDESDGGDVGYVMATLEEAAPRWVGREHGVWMRRWAKAVALGDRAAILITWYAPQVIR